MPDWVQRADEPLARVIRVFISSTFRDMQAERDELAKRIFPQLRKLCESRGVTWGGLDLRWGITDEQKAEGKVLPTCLAVIHNCRPYFIGLLGDRYGWVPDEVPPALIAQEPWLAEYRGHSVTELEILHGVLRNPKMAEHVFFYFRSSSYVNSLRTEQQMVYREVPSEEEIEKLGAEEARRRAEERKQKLARLKDRIRESGLPVRENYPDPRALGERVLADLTAVINRLFPEGSQPGPLDREAAEHEIFARSRCVVEVRPGEKVGVYIGRREYFDQLDAHAAGDGAPLVVLGESGSGKTALLANWARGYRATHGGELVIQHFIGATPASADWMAMLRRILGEFNRRFELKIEIPDKPDALRAAFANALYMAATKGRVILILDALNQLEDRDQAPDLVWLPPVLPAGVRLIVSTLPGRPLDDLRKRGWPTLQVEPLNLEERKQLVVEYLAQSVHSLDLALVQDIASAPQTANPLYLRALLEELLLWGEHLTLGPRIAHYLSALTVPDLYKKILERYEEDYERERPGLVRDAMSLLWAARRGLSEAELMDLLGADGQPLPPAYWSPLCLAAEMSLVSRSGLIGFFHDYFGEAVRKLYLPTEEDCRRAHLRLADYFQRFELSPRQVDELPWQLVQAEAWQRLYALLADLAFFGAAWQANPFEVKANWTLIEDHSSLRMVDAYRPVLDAPQPETISTIWVLSILLGDTGHLEESFPVRSWLVEHLRATGDRWNLAASLGNQANILAVQGDLDGAMALYKEDESICLELGNKDGLQYCLGNQARVLYARGDLDGAMALLKEQERICRELRNKDGLQYCLGKQANIRNTRGDLDGAMALLKESERICRELGKKDGLSPSLDNQAGILRVRGDLDGAMALLKESERICRELGKKDGLQYCLGAQAKILYDRGDSDRATALLKEQERICRELGDKDGLSTVFSTQALILRVRGDLDGAMALLKESERICRELGDKDGLSTAFGNQAHVLYDRGDSDRATALLKEQERICRELGDKAKLSASLGNQANILYARGGLDAAMVLYKEQEQISRELGNKAELSKSFGNQALILKARGDLDGALALYREQEIICRELGNENGLQACLGNQARIIMGATEPQRRN